MKQYIKNSPFSIRLDMWRSALYLLLTLGGVMYSGAIRGGNRTTIYDFPYAVSVYQVTTQSHKCGGSLITPRHVLTVAHIFRYFDYTNLKPSGFKVIAGVTSLANAYVDEWSWGHDLQIRRVKKIILHEDFLPYNDSLPNNVAILTVTHEFYMTNTVQLTTLPTFQNTLNAYQRLNMTIAGYGLLEKNGTMNKRLYAVDIEVLNIQFCQKIVARVGRYIINEQNMCTLQLRTPRIKNICRGDEGGPGVINGTQVAMVMWPTCGTWVIGFFMRTDYYLDWIKDKTSASKSVFDSCILVFLSLCIKIL